MTNELIDEIAERAARAAINKFMSNDLGQCNLCSDKDYWTKHEMHHQFLDELIATLKRLQDVKWSSIKGVVGAITLAVAAALMFMFFGVKIP